MNIKVITIGFLRCKCHYCRDFLNFWYWLKIIKFQNSLSVDTWRNCAWGEYIIFQRNNLSQLLEFSNSTKFLTICTSKPSKEISWDSWFNLLENSKENNQFKLSTNKKIHSFHCLRVIYFIINHSTPNNQVK